MCMANKQFHHSWAWAMDAANVVEDAKDGAVPNGWASAYMLKRIKEAFDMVNWKIDCFPRETNSLADAAAAFSVSSGFELLCDEFSVGALPPTCLDLLFTDKLQTGPLFALACLLLVVSLWNVLSSQKKKKKIPL